MRGFSFGALELVPSPLVQQDNVATAPKGVATGRAQPEPKHRFGRWRRPATGLRGRFFGAVCELAARQGVCSMEGLFRVNLLQVNLQESKVELADKPGSVAGSPGAMPRRNPACSHSSRVSVAEDLQQPTRIRRGPRHRIPIWPCSGRGLPSHPCYHARGALLPHPFTLTANLAVRGGLLSVALSVSSRFPGVTWRPVLWSPDFPLAVRSAGPDRQRLHGQLGSKRPPSGEPCQWRVSSREK